MPSPTPNRIWWKESSVYQVYPSSYLDTTGSGHGDIQGITRSLDYIHSLGVDMVWLSPILASPQVDMGYDISDYRDIHAGHGTMADHDELIAGLHARGMKYVMDLVVNHTSDQHEWFKRSRERKNDDDENKDGGGERNEWRDWYIWRPPRYDEETKERLPPNNWLSCFGGSAWTFDPQTQEYYLHLFAVEQPDLNWENPSVRSAIHAMIRFWLQRGVDGFRMDVINFISKEPGLPDAPVTEPSSAYQSAIGLHSCGPRLHEYLREIGGILNEFGAFSVGEMPGVGDEKEVLKSVGQERGELNMILHFEMVSVDSAPHDKYLPQTYTLPTLKRIVSKWQRMMLQNHGWNALYLENHDQPRSISRFASDSPQLRKVSGKMLATFLALQSGTPFIFQGQEIGQINVPPSWGLGKYRDIETLNHWQKVLREHGEDDEYKKMTLQQYQARARDNGRTPMQWDKSPHAGFTTADKPWMDVHPDFEEWNVENQVNDPDSVYSYWKAVLKLRKEDKDVFVYGDFVMLDPEEENSIAYVRRFDDRKAALVVTSFKDHEVEWEVPEEARAFLECPLRLQNYEDEPKVLEGTRIQLRPFEALVFVTPG